MIEKLTKKSILLLLALAIVFLLSGLLTLVRPYAATNDGDVSPFYENPWQWNTPKNTIVKGADGSYAITQSESGGNARLFYGDYVMGGSETPYYVNLTDFTMDFSVDKMSSGGNLMIGFLTYAANGDYPLNGYGQGFVLKLNDDGGGNTGFVPTVETVAKSDANHTQYTTGGNSYLVYNNATTGRTSHIGKKMTLHVYVEGNNLNVYVDWALDDVNQNTA